MTNSPEFSTNDILNKDRIKRVKVIQKQQRKHQTQVRKIVKKILNPTAKARRACKKMGITLQIQRGFKIAEKWKNDNN